MTTTQALPDAKAAEPQTWFDKGAVHFESCLRGGDRLTFSYPTQDRHTPADEAEYLRGYESARARHQTQKLGDEGDGKPWLEGY